MSLSVFLENNDNDKYFQNVLSFTRARLASSLPESKEVVELEPGADALELALLHLGEAEEGRLLLTDKTTELGVKHFY